jgi:hypothetical protein
MITVVDTFQLPKADHTGRGTKDLPEHCSEMSGRSRPFPQVPCPLARRKHSLPLLLAAAHVKREAPSSAFICFSEETT